MIRCADRHQHPSNRTVRAAWSQHAGCARFGRFPASGEAELTQAAKADFYRQFVCGQILVTLREAFAVAPGLTSARVVVLRNDGRDVYGQPLMPCLAAVTVPRQALVGVRWDDADAVNILNAVAREALTNLKGRSKELAPIDLTGEPDIAALVKAVDLEELAGDG